jgi:hypothetical protein
MGTAHEKYLIKRKFDPSILKEQWGLQGTTYMSGEWNWRIIFPILDKMGDVVSYGGRAIGEGVHPKYKLPLDEQMKVDPRQLLYGIHKVKNSVVIVEGPADVWRLGPGAVATLGINWKKEQALILKNFPRRFIMFDPEYEAQKEARDLAKWLGMYSGETEIISDISTDPGDMSQEDADALMRELKI